MSVRFGLVGTLYSGGDRPLTCPAISCFAFWLTDFKPIAWVTWMARAGACLITLSLQRTPDSVPRTLAAGLRT